MTRRKESADRQLTLAALRPVRWADLPEETRQKARAHLGALLRAAALKVRLVAQTREGHAHEPR